MVSKLDLKLYKFNLCVKQKSRLRRSPSQKLLIVSPEPPMGNPSRSPHDPTRSPPARMPPHTPRMPPNPPRDPHDPSQDRLMVPNSSPKPDLVPNSKSETRLNTKIPKIPQKQQNHKTSKKIHKKKPKKKPKKKITKNHKK